MTRRRAAIALLALASVLTARAIAADPDELLDDPALEARARALSQELRCVVCQSQSIADSDAPLAKDLRILVRERIAAGDTDAEARDYIVARYGDYVLLKPPLQPNTIVLWAAPFVVLAMAGGAGVWFLRRQRDKAEAQALSRDEDAAVDKLIE